MTLRTYQAVQNGVIQLVQAEVTVAFTNTSNDLDQTTYTRPTVHDRRP